MEIRIKNQEWPNLNVERWTLKRWTSNVESSPDTSKAEAMATTQASVSKPYYFLDIPPVCRYGLATCYALK